MKLSIIIVNYNVKYFLDQTLRSILRSRTDFDYEIIVVDNDSSDGSVEFVEHNFPQVTLIRNGENLGFSKANNIGIKRSAGDFILLLNPDTIVAEETLQKCVDKMIESPRIGGLGVKMIDGSGKFLPESKRGLPTPMVAFFKAFGLSRLFPKSSFFNYYHLGHIDASTSAEVDVLSGAFMMMRREVIDLVGGLDEDFFMYGEDIDLSYRIQRSGYINWYEANTSIVHFKGESTKKGSLNYVKVFYQAMIIFANKHFVGKGAFLMSFLYRMAVFLRAGASLTSRGLIGILPILFEAALIFAGLRLLSHFWATYYFQDAHYYSSVPLHIHHSIYTLVWIFFLYLGGSYDRYWSIRHMWRALLWGTIILLIAFSLVPGELRPSRAIVLLGSVWTFGALYAFRNIAGVIMGYRRKKKRIAIVGGREEMERTRSVLDRANVEYEKIMEVPVHNSGEGELLGGLEDLGDIVEAYQLNEVIFCSKDLEHSQIMKWMARFADKVPVKIIQEEGLGIIGSRYKNKQGELYAMDAQYAIAQVEKKRQKRWWDVGMCLLLIPTIIFWIWAPAREKILGAWWFVLIGKRSWVGYDRIDSGDSALPVIKQGIFNPAFKTVDPMVSRKVNFLYAKDYSVWMDFDIFWRSLTRKR